MKLEKIIAKANVLDRRLNGYTNESDEYVSGIIDWIKSNPNTDPNIYEIMDCNIEYAEILAALKAYYEQTGYPIIIDKGEQRKATIQDLPKLHSVLGNCFFALAELDDLRDIEHHPFCNEKEAHSMYCAIKTSQLELNYILATDPGLRKIKKEILCKSMSVAFYIWQTKRTEPNYQYDNMTEFEEMKEAYALYESTESPCQFASQIQALCAKINVDYKFNTSKNLDNKVK